LPTVRLSATTPKAPAIRRCNSCPRQRIPRPSPGPARPRPRQRGAPSVQAPEAQPAEPRCPGPTGGASGGSTAGPLPKPRKRAGKGPSAGAAARFRPRQTAGRAQSHPPEGAVGRGLICRHAARRRCVRAGALRPGSPAGAGWGLVGREGGGVHPAMTAGRVRACTHRPAHGPTAVRASTHPTAR
jgi:hypothetical protein